MMLPVSISGVLFVIAYVITTLVGKYLTYHSNRMEEYSFKKDIYLYVFVLFFAGMLGIHFFIPDFYDLITPISVWQICAAFGFAGVIYLMFLLEMNYTLNIAVIFFSVLSSFLFVSPSALPTIGMMPLQIEILLIGLIFAGFVFSAKTLIGLPGIFSCFISISLVAVMLLSAIGALPAFCMLAAGFMLGSWVSIFQKNVFNFELKTNEGALMSVMFLLGSFYLIGVNEFCASSMLILMTYPLAEFIWCGLQQYFFKRQKTDLYLNTFYFTGYEKDVSLSSLHLLLFKLGIINGAMALFQTYSPNALTLPILAFAFNFWLLVKLYYADKETPTLRETNKELVENIKNEIKNIKQNFKKD